MQAQTEHVTCISSSEVCTVAANKVIDRLIKKSNIGGFLEQRTCDNFMKVKFLSGTLYGFRSLAESNLIWRHSGKVAVMNECVALIHGS